MGTNRLIVRWARRDLTEARDAIREVMRNKTDYRAKLHAARSIADDAWREYEHDHPTLQKLDVTTQGDKINGFEVVFVNKTDTATTRKPATDGAPQ